MKQTVNFSEFCDRFRDMERNKHFTYEGKRALFDYLENYEEETGEEIELDIIALVCEYSEYADWEEFQNDYGEDIKDIEDLADHTTVIKIDDDRFIILAF